VPDPIDRAKHVAEEVAHPIETTKELAEEAEEGRSARTPAIAITGVALVVAVVLAVILAIALTVYFVYGG
jgi:CHASE3 domain sensor protein